MDFDLESVWREGGERWEKMTTREIAVELGTTVGALYRWARLGRIPGLTTEFLDVRRRMDPLREVDRAGFKPESGLIECEYTWNKDALKKLKRFESSEDLIETGFIGGRQGRFQDYISIRVRDRLVFYVDTTPIAFLDCQRTWFVVDFDDEDEDAEILADDVDIVADYIEGYHEEPYRIRPSLYFLNVEAAEDGLMDRSELDPSAPVPEETRMSFEILKDLAEEPWKWPSDAGESVLAVLLDQQAAAAERMLAAQFAGDSTLIDDELVEALLAILRSDAEPAPLRSQAALSLGPVLEEIDMEEFDDDPVDAPLTEETFRMLREALETLYQDAGVPDDVRRSILEAAVRSPQDWHQEAIRAAWSSAEPDWKRTAVFSMGFIKGFEGPILEALASGNPDLRYEAVRAAGLWQLDAAWEHIVPLIAPAPEDKPLLIAAIEAASAIRPIEASDLLIDLMDTEDEDILDAIDEAVAEAEAYE